jgi:hypothetical protein
MLRSHACGLGKNGWAPCNNFFPSGQLCTYSNKRKEWQQHSNRVQPKINKKIIFRIHFCDKIKNISKALLHFLLNFWTCLPWDSILFYTWSSLLSYNYRNRENLWVQENIREFAAPTANEEFEKVHFVAKNVWWFIVILVQISLKIWIYLCKIL